VAPDADDDDSVARLFSRVKEGGRQSVRQSPSGVGAQCDSVIQHVEICWSRNRFDLDRQPSVRAPDRQIWRATARIGRHDPWLTSFVIFVSSVAFVPARQTVVRLNEHR
jgi:hypothetical protein